MFAKAEHKNTATQLWNSFSAVGSPARSGRQGSTGTHANSWYNNALAPPPISGQAPDPPPPPKPPHTSIQAPRLARNTRGLKIEVVRVPENRSSASKLATTQTKG